MVAWHRHCCDKLRRRRAVDSNSRTSWHWHSCQCVVLVGIWVDISLWMLPEVLSSLVLRFVVLAVGIVVNGVATGLYIGARFGSGPRDGLMTGLAARGYSVRVVRTIIEAIVLISGFALGGSVGLGTVLFAVAIGPIAHQAIPFFTGFTAAVNKESVMPSSA